MVWVTVDVDLADITDDDIEREYLQRDLSGENEIEQRAKQFVQHIRCGDILIGGKHEDDLIDFIHDLANKIVV